MTPFPHTPVLLRECLTAFEDLSLETFVDGTLGAGGHAEAILESHPELKLFIGIDQDESALEIAASRLKARKNQSTIQLIHGNFSDLERHLADLHLSAVDAILVDLGVSSMQLDRAERGFSFMRKGPLDMRMDRNADLTAADIVHTWDEKALSEIFFLYGEEKNARKIARAIVKERALTPFETTLEFAAFIEKINRGKRRDIHPATQVFQALRIAVNEELIRLENFLPKALKALRPGGRLAVITFHSLEDRIVKHRFAYYADDKESTSGWRGLFAPKIPEGKIITRKAILAKSDEIERNPRARSAKLRVIEKI